MPDGTTKVCVACGKDVAGRPRVKDAGGRYMCQPCYDHKLAAAKAPSMAAMPAPAPMPAPDEGFDDVFGIASTGADAPIDEAAPAEAAPPADDIYAVEQEPARRPASVRPCPGCGKPVPAGGVICVGCGYNFETGKAVATKQGKAKAPKDDGVPRTLEEERRQRLKAQSDEIARMAYIKPAIIFLVCFGVMAMIQASLADDPAKAVLGSLLGYAIQIPIGLIVVFICCLVWIGFDAPWHLTAVRLAAVYSIVALFSIPAAFMGIFGLIGIIIVFGIAIESLLDFERVDGIIIACILTLINGIMAVLLRYYAETA